MKELMKKKALSMNEGANFVELEQRIKPKNN